MNTSTTTLATESTPGARRKCWLTPEARERGLARSHASATANAVAAYSDIAPMVVALRAEGQALQVIADILNSQGRKTRRGSPFQATQVHRILRRATP